MTGLIAPSLTSSRRLLADDGTAYTTTIYTKSPITITDQVNSTVTVSSSPNFKVVAKKVKKGSAVYIKVSLGASYK